MQDFTSHHYINTHLWLFLFVSLQRLIVLMLNRKYERLLLTCIFRHWFLFLYTLIIEREGKKNRKIRSHCNHLTLSWDMISLLLMFRLPVTGRQVLDEIEKMSSVERPIRSQQRGLNWTNRNTVSSWIPKSYQRMNRNMQTHAYTHTGTGMWLVN